MPISRKKRGKSNKDVYEKAEDLPEGKKKVYDSILEDFDKQGKIEYILDIFSLCFLFLSDFHSSREMATKNVANKDPKK